MVQLKNDTLFLYGGLSKDSESLGYFLVKFIVYNLINLILLLLFGRRWLAVKLEQLPMDQN